MISISLNADFISARSPHKKYNNSISNSLGGRPHPSFFLITSSCFFIVYIFYLQIKCSMDVTFSTLAYLLMSISLLPSCSTVTMPVASRAILHAKSILEQKSNYLNLSCKKMGWRDLSSITYIVLWRDHSNDTDSYLTSWKSAFLLYLHTVMIFRFTISRSIALNSSFKLKHILTTSLWILFPERSWQFLTFPLCWWYQQAN